MSRPKPAAFRFHLEFRTFIGPRPTGYINFSGTNYTGYPSEYYDNSTYIATAYSYQGSVFKNWNSTGGISVDNPLSNPTTIRVAGSGSLTAIFTLTPSTPLSPSSIIIASLLTSTILLLRRRRLVF